MKYNYTCPTKQGYRKVKVSLERHNSVFKLENRTIFKALWTRCEYWTNDTEVIVERLPTLFQKVVTLLLLPLNLVVQGITLYKEILLETDHVLRPKKYGAYTVDNVPLKYYNILKQT